MFTCKIKCLCSASDGHAGLSESSIRAKAFYVLMDGSFEPFHKNTWVFAYFLHTQKTKAQATQVISAFVFLR